jgi:hypothetical protein
MQNHGQAPVSVSITPACDHSPARLGCVASQNSPFERKWRPKSRCALLLARKSVHGKLRCLVDFDIAGLFVRVAATAIIVFLCIIPAVVTGILSFLLVVQDQFIAQQIEQTPGMERKTANIDKVADVISGTISISTLALTPQIDSLLGLQLGRYRLLAVHLPESHGMQILQPAIPLLHNLQIEES